MGTRPQPLESARKTADRRRRSPPRAAGLCPRGRKRRRNPRSSRAAIRRSPGAKAKIAWLIAVTSATTVPTSAGRNSRWAISGGSEVRLPTPRPNSTQPAASAVMPSSKASTNRAGRLHPEIGSRSDATIAFGRGAGQHGPSQHGAQGDEADRRRSEARPELRPDARQQMGEEADLRKQAKREGQRDRDEAPLLQERGTCQRCGPIPGRGRRLMPEEVPCQRTDDADHRAAQEQCGHRQIEGRDQHGPQRHEDHAADTGAIEGHADGLRSFAVEPWRHDGVECRAAGRGPAGAADQHGRHEMPRLRDIRPGDRAKTGENGAGQGDARQRRNACRLQAGQRSGPHLPGNAP